MRKQQWSTGSTEEVSSASLKILRNNALKLPVRKDGMWYTMQKLMLPKWGKREAKKKRKRNGKMDASVESWMSSPYF